MRLLDSHVPYETPEGIELKLAVAGPLVRAMAWLVDICIRAVIYIALSFALIYFGSFGIGILFVAVFFIEWFYPTIFEAHAGATPGKQVMKLRVIMEDGTALTWRASLVRNLLRTVDFLPAMYLVGMISSICNAKFQRLGDIVANSIVVYDEEHHRRQVSAQETARARALSIPLSVAEQRLILQFNDMKHSMTPSRQMELANILTPITNEKDSRALEVLEGYAVWVKGGQR